MINSSLCGYSDAYIFVKGTITIAQVKPPAQPQYVGKNVVFKNCTPFTDCISEINNAQIDDAKYINVIMAMYNLVKYSDNYSKTSRGLWQYHRYYPALTDGGAIAEFSIANKSASLKFKQKITGVTGVTGDDSKKNVEIMVPLKYLSNFWRTLAVPLINCGINKLCLQIVLYLKLLGIKQNICNNRYKILCSSFNFINSR